MAEYGDKPYAVFLHRSCLTSKNELAMLEAAEHRLHADKSGLVPTQAEYHKSVLSTPGSEPF